jgi:hypothetical protein
MTKFESRLAKSAWAKALSEGRVVRFNSGASFKALKTVEDARAFAAMLSHTDRSATIVKVTP